MLDKDLKELAEAYGLAVSYHDESFQPRHSPPEAILAILQVLGAPIKRPEEAVDVLRHRKLSQWRQRVEPVLLAWDGQNGEGLLRLPAAQAPRAIRCTLELEGGESQTWDTALSDSNLVQAADVEGVRFHQHRVILPFSLPLGYHRLRIEASGQQDEALVLAAPTESYRPAESATHDWGVFLPLHALRTERNLGIGDFTDLGNLLAWTRQQGGALVGALPLMASFIHQEEKIFEPSPYSPASRLFWNEIFLDLERIPELARCPSARNRLASADFRREIERLRGLPQVDYQRTMALKRQVLTELAAAFFAQPSARGAAFQHFKSTHPRVEDYARFRGACERHGTSWWSWPERQRQGTLAPGDYDDQVCRYHLYAQWQAHEQMSALATRGGNRSGLYLDLPMGSSSDSYDVWRDRAIFALGASAGAPPDGFAIRGQNWGFPPVHPERQREQGYRYLREMLANLLSFTHMLRIDHMAGLHRLYFIPNGAPATDGVYVTCPYPENYAVFCLESQRRQALLVGEDLGIVPESVRPAMTRHKVDRLFVAQFQYRPLPDGSAPLVPDNAVASLNTHDVAPYAAFCRNLDLKDRLDLGLIDPPHFARHAQDREGFRNALAPFLFREGTGRRLLTKAWRRLVKKLGTLSPFPVARWNRKQELAILQRWLIALGESPARVVLVNLEDLWLCPDPQNVPGTWKERPNWKRRASHTFEEFTGMAQVVTTLQALNQARNQRARQAELPSTDEVTKAA